MRVEMILPIWADLRRYRREWLAHDLLAGLGIAAIAIPIGIAYPAIAGLPPVTGLYATIFPLVAYALFGSSRQHVVGPDTAASTVLASSLILLSADTVDERVALASSLAVLVGVLCLLANRLRLGFIADFLSHPILVGYLCGIALALFAGQIGRFTGMSIIAHGFIRPFVELARRIDEIHGPTLAFAAGLFVLLRIMRLLTPRVPGPLVAVALAIALSITRDLSGEGLALVGEIATGLPTVVLPDLRSMASEEFALSAIGIFVVSFISGIVTARSFATRNRYRIDADRELIGFGAANVAAGLFGGFPVAGADSRTAINDALGGKTQVAGLVAAVSLAFSLLFLTPPGPPATCRTRRGPGLSGRRSVRFQGTDPDLAHQSHRIRLRAHRDPGRGRVRGTLRDNRVGLRHVHLVGGRGCTAARCTARPHPGP
jgi:sulfate permease, SulP family